MTKEQYQKREVRLKNQFSAFLAFLILATIIFLASCQPSKPAIPKYDKSQVFTVIYVANGARQAAQGKIDSIYHIRAFTDSNSLNACWKLDTGWSLLVPNQLDTLKVKNKPVYDSIAHQYKFNTMWYKLNPAERQSVRVQIITI